MNIFLRPWLTPTKVAQQIMLRANHVQCEHNRTWEQMRETLRLKNYAWAVKKMRILHAAGGVHRGVAL